MNCRAVSSQLRAGFNIHTAFPLRLTTITPTNTLLVILFFQMPGRNIDRLHLFVTTWNMGGVEKETFDTAFESMLPTWVPKGYDLYVIGLQECACLREMRQCLQDYLGK